MATICDNIVEPTISDPRVSRISIGSIQQIGFFNNNLTATIALDSGAEANCITVRECRRLNVPILPSNHTAVAVDKKTKVQVVGEIRTNFERNGLDFYFEGLVCPKLANEIIGGVPFLKKNNITQELNDNRISVNKLGKLFHIMEIPAFSPNQTPIQSRIMLAESTPRLLLPNDYIEIKLSPEFQPDQSYLLQPSLYNSDLFIYLFI